MSAKGGVVGMWAQGIADAGLRRKYTKCWSRFAGQARIYAGYE